MMALLGFAVLIALGIVLVCAGVIAAYATSSLGGGGASFLLISIGGGVILYLACKHGPLTVSISASAT